MMKTNSLVIALNSETPGAVLPVSGSEKVGQA